jgi:hypothetical protein
MNALQYAFADRAQEQQRLASQAELFDPLISFALRVSEMGCGEQRMARASPRLWFRLITNGARCE